MFAALQLIGFPAGEYLSQFYRAYNSSAEEMCAFSTPPSTQTGQEESLHRGRMRPGQFNGSLRNSHGGLRRGKEQRSNNESESQIHRGHCQAAKIGGGCRVICVCIELEV